MELIDDDDTPGGGTNRPAFTVSELSGAVKRMIEGEFGLVRVRGEVGRVSRPGSGHLYFNLKDDRASLDALCWKGQIARLTVKPEEGLEVVATGRMTTFPGASKYQLIVDDLSPAGMGALMAMLEKRRAALAAEGLFDPARRRPLPYLPRVIGVVTSPSGAVIRDILHRLRDRFPVHVLVWPVPVQGAACAPEVAAAIRGFNALAPGGPVPRPDVIIVARGGGSIEDLWGFNEEVVARAAAGSEIPLISAVGHETDTTLIDHAADRRAPTPTAAAEMAVPVRADLVAAMAGLSARAEAAVARSGAVRRQRLRDLARALPRPETLTEGPRQRLDAAGPRLGGALGLAAARKRARLAAVAGRLAPGLLAQGMARRGDRLVDRAARLEGALARLRAAAEREAAQGRAALAGLAARLAAAAGAGLALRVQRLTELDRLRLSLGPRQTLARGYAIVRGDGAVVTGRAAAAAARVVEVEFHDGRLVVGGGTAPRPGRRGGPEAGPEGGQGSLF